MNSLGFVLYAFVCYSAETVDLSKHECEVVKGNWYQTYDECAVAGNAFEDSIKRNGFGFISGVCRNPLMSEQEYQYGMKNYLKGKEGSF